MDRVDEVPAGPDAEDPVEDLRLLGREHAVDLVLRPEVELPLLALGVGVLGREERAPGREELAEHVGDGLLRRVPVRRLSGRLVGLDAGEDEERLVVEHLLEVRHEPAGVRRVPVDAVPELVVDPPAPDRLEGPLDHLERTRLARAAPAPEQEEQVVRRRELRRVPEPAVDRVELEDQGLVGPLDRPGVHLALRRRGGRLRERGRHLLGRLDERAAPLAPHLRDPRDELAHPRRSEPGLLREIGPGEERAPVRGQDHGQGPAARAGQELADGHVDLVHVGPLLAVDLDADERLVQELGDLWVLERLAGHHVAPVAGRVPDGEEDRAVERLRPLEGLVAPGIPVDGLAGVGEQVRALLVDQPVRGRVVGHRNTSRPGVGHAGI